MRRGEIIVGEVIGLSPQGDGLVCLAGKRLTIPRAVPGDKVKAMILGKRKGNFEAELVELLDCERRRRVPICPHFGVCGSCRWQDLEYEDQLALKKWIVRDALESKGWPWPESTPILASPEEFFYRNKMEFSFGKDRGGQLQLGLHLRGRFNRLFDVESCCLQSSLSNHIVAAVRRNAVLGRVSPYDLREHQGLLRFLVIRDSKRNKATMVNLIVAVYPCEVVDQLIAKVFQEVSEIDTWVVSLHQGKAQIATGQQEFNLRGAGTIIERCGEIEYEISSRSFFQTNSLQAERLYKTVVDWAGDLSRAKVLDLYCGTGGIALQLARRAQFVWGVEIVPEAVEDARRNARRNGIENCTFILGPVEKVIGNFGETGFALAIVDPPRAGMHPRALTALAALRPPRILYIACNPWALVANLEGLVQAGYGLKRMCLLDMFPQTPHCEVIAELALGEGICKFG